MSHWIIGRRQTGKTTKALDWLRDDEHRVLLVASQEAAASVSRQLSPEAKQRVHVVNGQMWAQGMPTGTEIGIDDLHLLLNRLLGLHFPITLVTATADEVRLTKTRRTPKWLQHRNYKKR